MAKTQKITAAVKFNAGTKIATYTAANFAVDQNANGSLLAEGIRKLMTQVTPRQLVPEVIKMLKVMTVKDLKGNRISFDDQGNFEDWLNNAESPNAMGIISAAKNELIQSVEKEFTLLVQDYMENFIKAFRTREMSFEEVYENLANTVLKRIVSAGKVISQEIYNDMINDPVDLQKSVYRFVKETLESYVKKHLLDIAEARDQKED